MSDDELTRPARKCAKTGTGRKKTSAKKKTGGKGKVKEPVDDGNDGGEEEGRDEGQGDEDGGLGNEGQVGDDQNNKNNAGEEDAAIDPENIDANQEGDDVAQGNGHEHQNTNVEATQGPSKPKITVGPKKNTARKTGKRKEKEDGTEHKEDEPHEAAFEPVEGFAQGNVAKQSSSTKNKSSPTYHGPDALGLAVGVKNDEADGNDASAENREETAEDRAKSERQEAKHVAAQQNVTSTVRIRKLGFFALPPEVRDIIYEHALIADGDLRIAEANTSHDFNEPTHHLSVRPDRPRPGGYFNASLARVTPKQAGGSGAKTHSASTHSPRAAVSSCGTRPKRRKYAASASPWN
ncbi:hypothetical protein P171DRAFT_72918 [Karstenula rhodostoma CBS 690.94]|uniref:Uncharacterized protein n=1 Tax=Karstenula rhodostoma CBS 690.94 TaxID=1392251 RepID=A0A9P4PCT1_9PLEO|nr:hypothetical protein P171DRAFT_72918 [Karstenula rhodostoma CBS 690.94]